MIFKTSLKQLVRYGIVGLSINGAGYALYLFLTWLGASPFIVVSIFYPLAVFLSFALNRSWSFSFEGDARKSFIKFLIAHGVGYLLNVALLFFFTQYLHFPHQWVQLGSIFVVAGYLFLMMKFYVYR